MAGIMNTLWDESSELEDEMLTPHPILSDDYTAHDMTKLDETIEKVPGCFVSLRTAGFFALCSTL